MSDLHSYNMFLISLGYTHNFKTLNYVFLRGLVSLPRGWVVIFENTLEISQANVFPMTGMSICQFKALKWVRNIFSLAFFHYYLVVRDRMQTCIVH